MNRYLNMRIGQIFLIIPALVIVLFFTLTGVLGDLFWFESIGYSSVFLKMILMTGTLFLITTLVFFLFSYGNVVVASRTGGGRFGVEQSMYILCIFGCVVASLIAGLSTAGMWETVLSFLNQTPFQAVDPIFGLDIGFYIFALPFWSLIVRFLLILCIFTAIISFIAYQVQRLGIQLDEEGNFSFSGTAPVFTPSLRETIGGFLPQLNALLFLTFTFLAATLYLNRYSLLYTSSGTVFGAGYTDVNVTIPVLTILSILSFVIGVFFLINEKLKRPEYIVYGIGGFIAVVIVGMAGGAVMQSLIVQPNEFNLERPFLEYNINSTLAGYNLDHADAREFPVTYTLTGADLQNNTATISNIRLWDWRPMKTALEQLQLFRTYYAFHDVDVDRYWLNGTYKQVLVSAREMNTANLPSQAQTWVNQHLVYTHGYGAVMSPVDRVTSNGLPEFFVKDIPPTSPYLTLDQPRLYYGEGDNPYIITNTGTEEFDYPSGDENIYTIYDKSGGMLLNGLSRLVYAINLGSVELLVSGSLTPESRLHLHRSILDRVSIIAPFLKYDSDPYVVISEGRLFWIIDAYTVSDKYPYSEASRISGAGAGKVNYIRNSVKVVIDAYSGDVNYYVVEASDPMISTYAKIFPDLFRPMEEMSEDLQKHIRYPASFFQMQAEMYATYHMKDPRVFYNREDAWVIPDEVYRENRQRMEPYYVIMKLPGEEREEFILMLPFTPRNKQNLIGWMAARCDPKDYGKLIVYQFSKQELTYGPMQIEAKIDQDPEISQSITLWSQSGSSVVRGNTLVIPVEESLIYVEPLYLEATEKGTLPQLQRVIVSYGDRLTMQPTLAGSLQVLFGDSPVQDMPELRQVSSTESDSGGIIGQIAGLYSRAQQALVGGRLGEYQQYVDRIGSLVSGYSVNTTG